jgi:hypothetical protein
MGPTSRMLLRRESHLASRRARWPGHKPICIDRDGADPGIDCCTQLDQPKSRLYAARALSAESPQQSAVVAYSRDFGLRPGQAVNRVPAGERGERE